MTGYLLRRLGTSILTLLLASLLVYFATAALPGDVAQQLLGQDATEEALAELRTSLGLDRGVVAGYGLWLAGMLRGDLGVSLVSGLPVAATVGTAFAHTMMIALPAIVIGVGLSVALGVVAARRRGRAGDWIISGVSLTAMSIPEFVVATLLVLGLAIVLPIFPAVVLEGPAATPADLLPAIWLPALALILVMAAYIIRATRSAVIDTSAAEFALTAELRGIPSTRVLLRHILPTALLPVLPVIAINIAWLLGGVVVVETIFNYPGLGKLMIDSVSTRDLPVLQAIALITATVYVTVNLIADVLAMVLDPRQRTTASRRTRREETRA